ncbi:MAG: M20/M25/M40 family metallo-hydrolase [Bdellovibrionales bacterium]|nr:M20/M25/M40 family metallo-hydrolase [Bdellovibrionales bacterium]
MVTVQELEKLYDQSHCIKDLESFLRFESISTDPAYEKQCVECANWLREHLKTIGLQAEVLATDAKPVVFAEYSSPKADAPRILFYGHYDVQPPDPLEEWTSAPFSPEVRDGRVFARGAQDNKGQVMFFVKALEALLKRGDLPVSVALVIEGEEECGSGGIARTMGKWKEKLKSDVLMVCDTGSRAEDVCAITMGLRGIAGLTVRLSGPRTDLHSGVHGGVCPNPATELARIIASLHGPNGEIAVEGYYDDVPSPLADDLLVANGVVVPDEYYESMSGVKPFGGEKGKSFAERRGFRPTIEINGIHSGYGGAGMKTIIPRDAIAKITTRTVAGQDTAGALKKIEKHLLDRTPPGLTLTIEDTEHGGSGLSVSTKSPVIQKAREVLSTLPVGQVELMWEGASIPIVASLAEVAGAEPLLIGFGLEEDNIHAPNESFSLSQFKKGFLYVAGFLSSYGAE